MNRREFAKLGRALLVATALTPMALAVSPAFAEETIKVGILHSLSGTMAISETTLKDVMLMLIDEQNKKGGLLGIGVAQIGAAGLRGAEWPALLSRPI